jgi:hypothetical protein
MISIQLTKLAQQNQWQILPQDNIVYGSYNGYRFSAMDGIGFKAIFTPVAGISPDGLKALLNWLDENKKQLKLRNYELSDNFLCVRLQESFRPRTADQLEWMLAQLSGMLDQFEMPKDACVICGQPAEKQGLLSGLFCALHPECQDTEGVDFTTINTISGDDDIADDVATSDEPTTAGDTSADDDTTND